MRIDIKLQGFPSNIDKKIKTVFGSAASEATLRAISEFRKHVPRKTGKLQASWRGSHKIDDRGFHIKLTSKLPYAEIQDQGGTIKARHATRGGKKYMTFIADDSSIVTAASVKIPAQHYVEESEKDVAKAVESTIIKHIEKMLSGNL